MAVTLYPGIRRLHLLYTTRYDTIRTTDVRDDLLGIKVWVSTTQGFNPQTLTPIDFGVGSSVTIDDLETNTEYFVRYAFISRIDPEVYTISSEVSVTTYDELTRIYGELTNDPHYLARSQNSSDPDWTFATGTFRVWNVSEEITGNGPVYSVVSGSQTNGLQVTIDPATGVFSASGWTGTLNTAKVTFKAVFDDIEVLRDWNIINGIGQDAPQIKLTLLPDNFIYEDVNAALSVVPQVTATASLTNLTGTATFTVRGFRANGTEIGPVAFTQSGNQITITNQQFANVASDIKYAVIKAEIADTYDEDTVFRLNNGTQEITIDISNPVVQLQADEDGLVDNTEYAETATYIEVYEGTTKLTPTSQGSVPTPGTWAVTTITGTGITPGSGTLQAVAKRYSYGAHAAMTADTANVVFEITYRTLAGVLGIREVRQNLSKSKQGISGATASQVNLRSDRLAFVRARNAAQALPEYIDVVASISNISSPTYSWTIDGVAVSPPDNDNILRVDRFTNQLSKSIAVTVSGTNSQLEPISLSDTHTLYYLEEGSDIVAADVQNASRIITCDSDGTPDSGNFPLEFKTTVVRGTATLSSPTVSYSIQNVVGLDSTKISINASTGTISVASHNPTPIFNSFDIVFTVGTTTVIKTVSLVKVLDGASAPIVNLTANRQVFIQLKNSSSFNFANADITANQINIPSPQVYAWYIDGTLQAGETGSSITVPAFPVGTSKLVKCVVSNTAEGISTFDQLTLFSVAEGSDAYTVGLVNENQTLPANEDGVLYNTTSPIATSSMIVLRGADVVAGAGTSSASVVFSVVTQSGLTASISNTGAIVVSAFTAQYSGEATFRATITKPDNTTIDLEKTLTINKTRDGKKGINSALVYAYKRASSVPNDNPGAFDYSFLTKAITTATLANNWQKTIPSGSDPLYVVIATAASDTTTDSVAANEWSSPPTLLVKNGLDGLNTASIFLYARNNSTSSAPAFSPGTLTYSFSSKSISGTLPTGWYSTIPAVSEGTVVWIVQATASSTTDTDEIASNGWSTPKVLAQKGDKGEDGTSLDVQYSVDNSTWTYNPAGAKYIRTGTKVPPATTFTYGAGVKFVPELGVEYTVVNGQTSYLHVKYSNDGGSTFTGNNGEDVGTWIGTYVDFTQADSTSTSTYTWVKIKGEDGTSIDVQYSIDNVSWTYNPAGAKYIRTGTKAAGASSFTYSAGVKFVPELGVEYTVVNGQTSYLHVKYSNDGGSSFTGNNGEDVGTYIGTYVDFTQADSTSVSSYTWVKIKGDDGTSVDIQYSVDNSTWTYNPAGAKYIRTGTKAAGASSFTYSAGVKFVPELGVEYTVVNGQTSYLHVKYSNDGGSSFTANNGEDVGSWIGTYVDFTQADSTSVSSYTWVKIKGEPGIDGSSVIVEYSTNNVTWTSSPTGAKYIRTGTKVPPATTYTYTAGVKFVPELGIEYTVVNGQTSYFHVKYSNDGGISFTGNSGEDAGSWIGTYVDFNQADSTSVSSYTWVKIKGDQGQTGQSNHRVYKVEAFGTAPGTPGNTTSGGTPSGWSPTPFTLSNNEVQWQSDGTTAAGSTTTTWSAPYQSYLKVAQLSAISADIGTITAGQITSGSSSDGVTVKPEGIKVTQGGVVRVRIGSLSNW